MTEEKRRPSHRLVIQHSEDSKYTTEVGAMWPHSKGGGFSITIKAGLSLSTADGARVVAFVIDHEARDREQYEREQEQAAQPDRRPSSRRGKS